MDATVDSPDYEHPQTLVQDTPHILTTLWSSGLSLIQNNGWFVLGLCVGLYYLYTQYRSSLTDNVNRVLLGQAKKEDGPASDEKLRLAREKMQKELERKAELYKEKQAQKAEEERKKKLEALNEKKDEGGPSQDSGTRKKTPLYREEYNPLMGSGPVNSYRPPRRSACSRGGCGR